MKEKRTCTVLLIDDCPEDRYLISRLLMQSKTCLYVILEAEDAASGLALCHQVHVDCVLLDYELPDTNGLDFLNSLRNEHNDVQAPVVMITGHGSENVAVKAMKYGAVDYLSKNELTSVNLFRVTQHALEKLMLANDLTNEARKKAALEERLKTRESHARALIDSVSEYGLFLIDEEGRVASWSTGARNLFNLHDYEILGQSFLRLFDGPPFGSDPTDLLFNLKRLAGATPKTQKMLRKNQNSFIAFYTLSELSHDKYTKGQFSFFVREIQPFFVDGKIVDPSVFAEGEASVNDTAKGLEPILCTTCIKALSKLVAEPIDASREQPPDTKKEEGIHGH